MKPFKELQEGDKIFIWDYQKKIADIGIINHVTHKDGYIVLHYYFIRENNNGFVLPLSLNLYAGAYTCNVRSLYSHYLISTYIDPILQLIKENEKNI